MKSREKGEGEGRRERGEGRRERGEGRREKGEGSENKIFLQSLDNIQSGCYDGSGDYFFKAYLLYESGKGGRRFFLRIPLDN